MKNVIFIFSLIFFGLLNQNIFGQEQLAPKFKFANNEELHQLILNEGEPHSVTLIKYGERSSDVKVTVDWPTYLSVRSGCSFDLAVYHFCTGSVARVINCSDCSSYNWSNGAVTDYVLITSPGTYRVTVTSAFSNCTSVAAVTLNQVGSPLAATISGSDAFCMGSNTHLTAQAVGGVDYCWNTGAKTQTISVTSPGTYTVTVTNANGCTGTATKNVVMVHPPQTPLISYTVVGDKVILTATPSGFYQWSNGATTSSIIVDENSPMKVLKVKVRNAEGCWSEESCPVPVVFIKTNSGGTGTSSSDCDKTGIKASNGMPYGAIFTPTTSQMFLFAPNGASQIEWNNGQNGGDNGWILISIAPGKHYYQLSCMINGKRMYYCFEYTCVYYGNKPASVSSSVNINDMFIPEEYQEEIQELLENQETEARSISDYLTNSQYMTNPNYSDMEIKVSPNPTTGQIMIEMQMEIPSDAKSGLYLFKGQLYDINGRLIAVKAEKVIKQE